jgi:integrase
MAVVHRNGAWFLSIRPFKKQITLKTLATNKGEARRVEALLLRACRTGDYGNLDLVTRETCIRLFQNQKWEMPPALSGVEPTPKEELTLWRACELFTKYPETKKSPSLWRYEFSIVHLAERLGKETPVKSIWVPALKLYQIDRLAEGARPGTVNWELSTLSKIFRVLIELQLTDSNPCRLVPKLSERDGQRHAYISYEDFQAILDRCPAWVRPIFQCQYYGGLRLGEVLGLRRNQVHLSKRILYFGPSDVKERSWKRVPVHNELLPVLEEALRVTSLESDRVFLIRDASGVRPPNHDSIKNPWRKAVKALKISPTPRPHDLRHSFRTNCRRSGIDSQIAESILGHWNRTLTVSDRYGVISDEELVNAINCLKFNFGPTTILVASDAGF